LDDADNAVMIVRHYAAGGYGAGRIKTELNRRGIPKDLWDAALLELPEGTESIDRLLAARLRGRDASDRKEREKAAAALFRKGYSWEDIRAALRRYGCGDE
ncbi:MAG: RecX family transcriptional regulator, partial [Oscillospiraceae bacterium]|nr:RecX family transcriptional regulator [Oscillospiraceae bacterium]